VTQAQYFEEKIAGHFAGIEEGAERPSRTCCAASMASLSMGADILPTERARYTEAKEGDRTTVRCSIGYTKQRGGMPLLGFGVFQVTDCRRMRAKRIRKRSRAGLSPD